MWNNTGEIELNCSLPAAPHVAQLQRLGNITGYQCMKMLNWVRFTWDLKKLPSCDLKLPAHYQIAPATVGDERELRKVYSSSFLLDPIWNPVIGEVMQSIQSRLDDVFVSANGTCLALRHGARIIGAAVLSLQFDAEDHLAPGPCVLMEYRNRGFGSHLLAHALRLLRDAGLTHANGLAPDYVPASKFLYPKFHSVISPVEVTPRLAA
jgi:GNAT superfamily N-acetyltransferase